MSSQLLLWLHSASMAGRCFLLLHLPCTSSSFHTPVDCQSLVDHACQPVTAKILHLDFKCKSTLIGKNAAAAGRVQVFGRAEGKGGVGGGGSASSVGAAGGIGESGSAIARNGKTGFCIRGIAVAVLLGGFLAILRTLLSAVPPDFSDRWHRFFEEQPVQEMRNGGNVNAENVLFDRYGVVIATVRACGHRRKGGFSKRKQEKPLNSHDIPAYLWQAVVASEDRRFFEHKGIDFRGIARAILSLASKGGGSTITQQLVKNVFLTNERKWARKLIEIILAVFLETRMSKWDILHAYLNEIYWGHGTYGIEAASEFYFGKNPSSLTLGECAMLAGIIPAPERLSPFQDPSRGKKPQARALRRMVEVGFLDCCTAAAVVSEPLELGTGWQQWRAPFVVSEVLYKLNQTYGRDRVMEGGLQVYTTLDLRMQEIAEMVIRDGVMEYDTKRLTSAEEAILKTCANLEDLQKARQDQMDMVMSKLILQKSLGGQPSSAFVEKGIASIEEKFDVSERSLQDALCNYQKELKVASQSRMEAAMVAIDPMDGAVRVLVGGRDYFESSFNRCTQARRSPGSAFKPVVYLTAFAEGINRRHILNDEPYTIDGFSPENHDQKFRGKVTLQESFLQSLNVPTVKLCAEVGVDKVCHMGKVLGIDTTLRYELALSLGGCEVTPLQLATVYSTIASGGIYHKPHLISRVETGDGHILEEAKITTGQQNRVVSKNAVLELQKLLQVFVQRGTGHAAQIGRPCAGTTGTTDGHRDVWFAGFTPDLSCVVWLGYDDNTPIGGLYPGTGASHAAPIWQRFMRMAHEGLPIHRFHGNSDIPIRKTRRHTSRWMSKRGHKNIGNCGLAINNKSTWKDVQDWKSARSVWELRGKMKERTARHARNAAQMETSHLQWWQILQNLICNIL